MGSSMPIMCWGTDGIIYIDCMPTTESIETK